MSDETVAYTGWSLSAQEQIDSFRRAVRALKAENVKLRELAKELFKLANRGLMELDDDGFRRIVEEAEELGVADWGRGTCRVMTIGEFNGEGIEYYDVCSKCGYKFEDDPLNYCPSCGRRIEVDE